MFKLWYIEIDTECYEREHFNAIVSKSNTLSVVLACCRAGTAVFCILKQRYPVKTTEIFSNYIFINLSVIGSFILIFYFLAKLQYFILSVCDCFPVLQHSVGALPQTPAGALPLHPTAFEKAGETLYFGVKIIGTAYNHAVRIYTGSACI